MARLIGWLLVLSLVFGAQYSQALYFDENDDSSTAERIKKYAELGSGVTITQKDKKGRIISCIVVGQARISTVLGKARGLEMAQDRANLDCSAQFVKWLKEEVSIYQIKDDETVILMAGKEGKDDDSLEELGKSVEKTGKNIDTLSKGIVRGLQIIHREIDANGKTYTVVKGWKADTAEAAKKVSAGLASDKPDQKGKNDRKDLSSPTDSVGKKKIDKEIESRSATSEDASEFLPKAKKK